MAGGRRDGRRAQPIFAGAAFCRPFSGRLFSGTSFFARPIFARPILDQARAHQLAAQADAPEIRSARIAAIQSAMANGTYQVSPEQTAEAILSEQQVRDGTAV